MIVSHKYKNKLYVLSNDDLNIGDETFPISLGIIDDMRKTYNHKSFQFGETLTGFPYLPHIIANLHYSNVKSYEIQTNRGYGPIEKYFKVISVNELDDEA